MRAPDGGGARQPLPMHIAVWSVDVGRGGSALRKGGPSSDGSAVCLSGIAPELAFFDAARTAAVSRLQRPASSTSPALESSRQRGFGPV